MTMNLFVGEFVMINTYNVIIGRSIQWHYFVFYKLIGLYYLHIKVEPSNHSSYDNTIVVDEFDCPWVVIIADK